MSRIFPALVILALGACGESTPPSPPSSEKPAAQAAPAPAATPAPAPEAKAPEPPKPDPNRELAARVKRALEEEGKIQAAGIDVTATDGVVTLWGTASTDAEQRRALQVAAKVEGVKSVNNKIAVVRGS